LEARWGKATARNQCLESQLPFWRESRRKSSGERHPPGPVARKVEALLGIGRKGTDEAHLLGTVVWKVAPLRRSDWKRGGERHPRGISVWKASSRSGGNRAGRAAVKGTRPELLHADRVFTRPGRPHPRGTRRWRHRRIPWQRLPQGSEDLVRSGEPILRAAIGCRHPQLAGGGVRKRAVVRGLRGNPASEVSGRVVQLSAIPISLRVAPAGTVVATSPAPTSCG
jgi:hypothetical protein